MKVILDSDLAELYEVKTFRLNEQVKRNIERFPKDFMFQLTKEEFDSLKLQNVTLYKETNLISQNAISRLDGNLMSQNVTSNLKFQNVTLSWDGVRKLPFVFTEQGVATLSGVLRSKKVIEVNIQIMRAFIAMRKFLSQNVELFNRLDIIEKNN